MTKIIAALLILGLNAYAYWIAGSTVVIPERETFASFPDTLSPWRCYERDELTEKVLNNLNVTDYLSCAFIDRDADEQIHFYVGYHETQARDDDTGKSSLIHPPEHCLPGSGWDIIDSSLVPVNAGKQGEAKRFIIAKGNHRSLVYFWYHSRGRVIARNHEKILYMFLDRARMGRTDGSLVRFTVPIHHGDIEAAEATFDRFVQSVSPQLSSYVPD